MKKPTLIEAKAKIFAFSPRSPEGSNGRTWRSTVAGGAVAAFMGTPRNTSPLPLRERTGPIARQWGGEGDGAAAFSWRQTPHPPRFAGPLPLPQGESEG